MELEEGEHVCSKCKGKGSFFASHSHSAPNHNHGYSSPPQHMWNGESSSYAIEEICQRCNGTGKLDWISNAMGDAPNKSNVFSMSGHTHSLATMPRANSNVSFYHSGTKMLEIKEDGIYIQDQKVEDGAGKDKKKIYERFNKFLNRAGY